MARKKVITEIDSKIYQLEENGDTYVRVSIVYSDKTMEIKTIRFEDYAKWLLGAQEEKVSFARMAEPPKYYIDGRVSQKANTFMVQLLVPAGKHQMVSPGFDFQDVIPFPTLLFDLVFSNGRASTKKVWAVIPEKDGTISPKTELYQYPFGNVSMSGDICMGNIAVKVDSITHADEFVEEFFLGETNSDYYQPKKYVSKDWNLGKLLNEVAKKDTFPKSWLVKTGKTYKNIMYV